MKTEVHFQSAAFNTTQPKDSFINRNSFGDDVCRWVIEELRAGGIQIDDEPGQEDFGWYVAFWVDGAKHFFIVGFQPGDDGASGQWLGWLERAGLFRALVGGSKRGISPRAVEAIDSILSSSPDVRSVSWHEQ